MKAKTYGIFISVRVPETGARQTREYHSPMMEMMEDRRPYYPAELRDVQVIDVPKQYSAEAVKVALQKYLDLGGGLRVPVRFPELAEGLKKRGLVILCGE